MAGFSNVCIQYSGLVRTNTPRGWCCSVRGCRHRGLDKICRDENLVATQEDSLIGVSEYTLEVATGIGEEFRFLWNATRGNRLRPWRSAYLRWRLETYSGQRAETIRARDFWNVFWKEKRQSLRFLRWTREIKPYSDSKQR